METDVTETGPMTADEFMASIREQEDLHPDLAAHLHEHDGLGYVLQHPLIYSIPHGDAINAYANRMYEQKQRMIALADAEGDIARIIHLHEKPWRLDALVRHHHKITDHGQFWALMRSVWIDTEVIHTNYDLWTRLWLHGRPRRESVMDDVERASLAALPETVRVYRGGHHRETLAQGFSWTTEREEAVWFARRFQDAHERQPHIAEANVRRADILAMFHTSEHEVVIDPNTLVDVAVKRVGIGSRRRPRSME